MGDLSIHLFFSPTLLHQAEQLPFDFVYSVAVLEHLDQPDKSLAELHRVLEPNGLTVHEIDLRDHGSRDPLRFLTLSEEQYVAGAQKYGDGRGIDQIIGSGCILTDGLVDLLKG
ncbi:MAG: methyltransferase domain-containing protein [Chloroflexota bacterium]|nr:methyltransferase domain-containing protein [Chloroflexota bacterium]